MKNNIDNALERLEKNLKDVQSAKEQVEKTVNESAKLKDVVSGYASSFNSISRSTSDLINELKRFKSEVEGADKFIYQSCKETIKSFQKATKETLNSFNVENENLAQAIDELKKKHTNLDKSINFFYSANSEINTELARVKSSIKDLHKLIAEKQDTEASKTSQINIKLNTIFWILIAGLLCITFILSFPYILSILS